MFEELPEVREYQTPSYSTVKRWMQKVGYYKLNQMNIPTGDWMIIIDASIQMGDQKCLVVLGCQMENFPKDRALNLEDMTILSMHVVRKFTAEVVETTLREVRKTTRNIASICSDKGSDVLRGIKDFQKSSPNTRQTCDTAHRLANFLRGRLEKNEQWKRFRQQTTQARREMQNSKISGFKPPSPRTKARFMNVGSLIEWASDVLLLLESPNELPKAQAAQLSDYLGWLINYRKEILSWTCLVELGNRARHLVRKEGLHMDIPDNFICLIADLPLGKDELEYSDKILDFFLEQTRGLKPGERYIGSSEVIESFFGKLKYMEKEQTAFGFTSLILAGVACVGTIDQEMVSRAIKTVKLSDIQDWSDKEVGPSVQSERRVFRRCVDKIKNILGTKASGVLERKVVGF
jgi:hypothetical protein